MERAGGACWHAQALDTVHKLQDSCALAVSTRLLDGSRVEVCHAGRRGGWTEPAGRVVRRLCFQKLAFLRRRTDMHKMVHKVASAVHLLNRREALANSTVDRGKFATKLSSNFSMLRLYSVTPAPSTPEFNVAYQAGGGS